MKQIQLTKGKFALVDDSDFENLNMWKWQAARCGKTYYAQRTDRMVSPRRTIKMHRQILNLRIEDERLCDHIDHNGLNNQKNNLRVCTGAGNCANRNCVTNSSSKFLGVTHKIDRRFDKIKHFWYAQIRKDGKTYFLGSFPFTSEGEIRAAKAYDDAAIKIHGYFSNLNFKEE